MTTGQTDAGAVVPSGNLFANESPVPLTDTAALAECVGVLERIMRDDLLCGVGAARMVNGQIERPLYGCACRAIDHAKVRLANAGLTGTVARQAKREALARASGGWRRFEYVLEFAVDPTGRFVALSTARGPMVCGSLRTIRSKVAQAIFRKMLDAQRQLDLPTIGNAP